MNFKKTMLLAVAGLLQISPSCTGQSKGPDGIFQDVNTVSPELYGIPKTIHPIDTSVGWGTAGEKLLVTGTVFESDGHTPAAGVTIYYYQTNAAGRYPQDPAQPRNIPPNREGHSHGYIRGWVRTGANGKYSIYTTRPGTYPSRDQAAHIHLTIIEPENARSYYIDDILFDDDELLGTKERLKLENRGGSGIVRLVGTPALAVAERNIILGLNIP